MSDMAKLSAETEKLSPKRVMPGVTVTVVEEVNSSARTVITACPSLIPVTMPLASTAAISGAELSQKTSPTSASRGSYTAL